MALGSKLADIVGSKYIFQDPETLNAYSRDQSFVRPMKPRMVVKPKNVDEVQEIVNWANQTATPLVPVSSGSPHFRGDTIPSLPEAIIVDLSGMKRIIRIDRRNRVVIVEPGVTFSELLPELAEGGLKLPMPFCPRSNKSVVASFLEGEPTLVPKYQWALPDPLRCLEILWGSGEKLWSGEAGVYDPPLEKQWEMSRSHTIAFGPGQVDYYRFVRAAQGTMGIITWASIRCEVLPRLNKVFFVPSERLSDLLGFAYRLLRFRYGDEFLFLDNLNLASILRKGADEIRALRGVLPPWVLILGVAGRDRLPKEKVEYQEKDMMDIAQHFGLRFSPSIPGVDSREVLEALLRPSREPYWKLGYKGGCQEIFFLSTLNKTPEFVETMHSLAERNGYLFQEVGIYIQPLMQGVACHCEFDLPFDPGNSKEVAKVKGLFSEASEALMRQGAFFSRPYGIWANMVYNRDGQSTSVLRRIKKIFDPNNVMNPGKLCF